MVRSLLIQEQNAPVVGGPLDLSQPKNAGAQLLWRPGAQGFKLSRFIAAVDFESDSPDGIGAVFARADGESFWYFLASCWTRCAGCMPTCWPAPARSIPR